MFENSKGLPPFRADHIGSLLRPAALRQAFRDHAGQRIDSERFAQIQDRCIRDAVAMQESAGLKVVTDGEFRRSSYWSRFVEQTDGFVVKPAVFKFRDDHGHELDFTAPYAVGKLKRNRALAVDEFQFLRGITGLTPKIALPSPSTMHFFRCTDFADAGAYATVDAYLADLGGQKFRKLSEATGANPARLVDLYIESLNHIVPAAPAGVTIWFRLSM